MKKLFFIFSFILYPITFVQAEYISMDTAILGTLDKITGRSGTIIAKVNKITTFDSLLIKVNACKTKPPEETPENAAFLEIVKLSKKQNKNSKVFSGWMFSSSPALSALDDPTYDVWVLKCTGNKLATSQLTAANPTKDETNIETTPLVIIKNEDSDQNEPIED